MSGEIKLLSIDNSLSITPYKRILINIVCVHSSKFICTWVDPAHDGNMLTKNHYATFLQSVVKLIFAPTCLSINFMIPILPMPLMPF
jgi:hypothetical protein